MGTEDCISYRRFFLFRYTIGCHDFLHPLNFLLVMVVAQWVGIELAALYTLPNMVKQLLRLLQMASASHLCKHLHGGTGKAIALNSI